ncbi:CENP-B N-terminal DNA-binding domain [Popillia japonica]|uniref:CENP-B N-terminal DNA-binding domain n=1 Tax=Popillia japonica TaxID=7064 RepID=A0AAW1N1V9_POPJA
MSSASSSTGPCLSLLAFVFSLKRNKSKRKAESAGNESKKQRSVITLEEKAKIIRMHENGKMISTIARDTNRPISTVNTIVKDKVRILENVPDAVTLKGTIITKKRLGPISEMEKLL